ncbi:MAG: GNAT family N-acetyltransferase [Muribaculum sp.]|nr:GNAT family N-acetyltransferase [Muribaculaceae bacterium]MCM1081086.1 GNAT family N-acetyltransferase [Muribaculum sp.]
MISLQQITTSSPYYSSAEQLWMEAFPEYERRETMAQRQNVDFNSRFHFILVVNGDEPCGMFTYWDFDRFIYCEHFAISPLVRGKGIGAEVLKQIQQSAAKPLVLEVELPHNYDSKRRIQFYQRNGFVLWDKSKYIQPPYRKTDKPLSMMLMSTTGLNEQSDFEKVKNTIHKKVYESHKSL